MAFLGGHYNADSSEFALAVNYIDSASEGRQEHGDHNAAMRRPAKAIPEELNGEQILAFVLPAALVISSANGSAQMTNGTSIFKKEKCRDLRASFSEL